jgi:hypothetical protein
MPAPLNSSYIKWEGKVNVLCGLSSLHARKCHGDVLKDIPLTLGCEIHGMELMVAPRDCAEAVLASIRASRFAPREV